MRPYRYKGKVVGIRAYERALAVEIERVRKLGLENRRKVADPNKTSRPGVWYDHVDPSFNPYRVSYGAAVDLSNLHTHPVVHRFLRSPGTAPNGETNFRRRLVSRRSKT